MLRTSVLAAALALALPFSALAADPIAVPPGEATKVAEKVQNVAAQPAAKRILDSKALNSRGNKRRVAKTKQAAPKVTNSRKAKAAQKQASNLNLDKVASPGPIEPRIGAQKGQATKATKAAVTKPAAKPAATPTATGAAASTATSTTAVQGSTSSTTSGTKAKPSAQSLSNPTAAGGQ